MTVRYPGGISRNELEVRLRALRQELLREQKQEAGAITRRVLTEVITTTVDVLRWSDIQGRPSTFPPSSHTHAEADIIDLDKYTQAEVDGLIAAIAFLLGELTDVDVTGVEDGDRLVYDDGTWVPRPALIGSLKAHRVDDFTYPDNTDWHILPMGVVVEDETLGGVAFTTEDNETLEFSREGLWYVSGCVRPVFTGGGNPSVISATRVIKSVDEGVTWVELRCLQSVFGRARGEDEPGTERFSGTVSAQPGDLIRLQGRTSNTDLILRGWSGFDNPVSASIELHPISEFPPEE